MNVCGKYFIQVEFKTQTTSYKYCKLVSNHNFLNTGLTMYKCINWELIPFFFFPNVNTFLPSTKSSILKCFQLWSNPFLLSPQQSRIIHHLHQLLSKNFTTLKKQLRFKADKKTQKIDLYVCGSLRVWNAGAGRFSPQNKGLRGNSGQLVFFDNNLVELLAVYDGLQEIYKTCGPNSKLTVYSSLDIASRVNGHSVSKPRYGPLLQRIKEQLKQFSGATITHAGSKHEHRKSSQRSPNRIQLY